MRAKHIFPSLLVVLASSVLHTPAQQRQVQSQSSHASPRTDNKQIGATHDKVVENRGERIFQQNCSRCHTAPDSFSPSISGTIVRHMRVRASLSQRDEQELLRFLNP